MLQLLQRVLLEIILTHVVLVVTVFILVAQSQFCALHAGKLGHMRRHRPKAKSGDSHSTGSRFEPGKQIRFFCDGEDHQKSSCPERRGVVEESGHVVGGRWTADPG